MQVSLQKYKKGRFIKMEEIKNATISINLIEGNIVISGSEDFVEKNMETVFSFVERANTSVYTTNKTVLPKEDIKKETDVIKVDNTDQSSEKDKYKKLGIYSVDSEDGTISIHRKIPGSNNAEKMKNVALIVLYEKGEPVQGSTLKALCEKQGCWDKNNSAAIFEREIKLFIKKKISAQKWTIALTIDGEQAAIELMEGMANDKK